MKTIIDRLFADVAQELKTLFGEKLSEIILYGSYARGDYQNDSDIDIMALVDLDGQNVKKYDKQMLKINVDLSLRYDVDLSLIIEDKTDFHLNRDIIPLFKTISREGKILYAA